ncbi:MAG: tetratricopeptide repeat protein [Phycisphaerae bacterium]|nr:tetratricopeptide repeat protein [Phycisphaerae bacterium]
MRSNPRTPTPPERSDPAGASRRYAFALAAVFAYFIVTRSAMLFDQRTNNLFYPQPLNDAEVYWDWAGRIAAGQFIDRVPFFSAPLYPYLLAGIRFLGGGFTAAYIVNGLLTLLATWLLAAAVRRRAGEGSAVLAAAVFVLLAEPAAYQFRIMNSGLQLMLVSAAWYMIERLRTRATTAGFAALGAALGLNCLATPAMLLPALAIVPWTIVHGRTAARWRGMIAYAAPVFALFGLITVHNARAVREFIPTIVSGLTFLNGNQIGGDGSYQAPPGFFGSRPTMYADAWRLYAARTGRTPTWSEVDAYFRSEGWRNLSRDPFAAARLWLLKTYWFFTGRIRDEVLPFHFEIESGFARSLRLAPVPTPWVLIPAMLGFAAMCRRPVRNLPELAIFVAVFIANVGFHYSPRYRMPIVPIATGLCAISLVQALSTAAYQPRRFIAAGALALALLSGPLNRVLRFDQPAAERPFFYNMAGWALTRADRETDALAYYQRAVEANPDFWGFRVHLGESLIRLGRLDEAVAPLREAVRLSPDNVHALGPLARLQMARGETDEALRVLERLSIIDPQGIAPRLYRHRLLVQQARYAEAVQNLEEALAAGAGGPLIQNSLAWVLATCPKDGVRNGARAVELARDAVAADPDNPVFVDTLAAALAERGEWTEAIRQADRARQSAAADGEDALAAEIGKRIDAYRAGRPWREGWPASAPAGG